MSADLDHVAKPGDPDLDLDVDGLTITAVQRMGHEVWVMARGGWGEFVATDGSMFHAEPADEGGAHLTTLEMRAGYPSADERMMGVLMARLEAWRDAATPLRVCGAPGRMFSVIEHRGCWLPFPRRMRGEG